MRKPESRPPRVNFLRAVTDPATVKAIARRILAGIAASIAYDGDFEIAVTASIGVATSGSQFGSADEIKRGADRALYAGKKAGRKAYRIFEPGAEAASLFPV